MGKVQNENKIAVISGGTSGVGKRTAIDLAKKNINIIILGRDKEKGNRAKREIIEESNHNHVEFYSLDLSYQDEIKKFVSYLKANYDHIDILVNAAGVMFSDLKLTRDGHDQNFILNYMAHFWIINEMIPLLKQAEQGRILLVGAIPTVINRSKVELPKLTSGTKYSGFKIVGEALVSRVLLAVALSEKLKDTKITINIFHPGYVPDSGYDANSSWLLKLVGKMAGRILSKKNVPIGMELALDPSLSSISGQLFNEKKEIIPLSANYNLSMANKLWDFSLEYGK